MEIEINNRKAYHDYFIEDTYEAGIVLKGTEIKSIRKGSVDLKDAYAYIKNHEVFLLNVYIAPYEEGGRFNHEPLRTRKLLLNKNEILRLERALSNQGYTLIPLKIYFKHGRAKVLIGVARGKKSYDKRQTLKERDTKRYLEK